MAITYRGQLCSAFSTASGSAPGNQSGAAAFQTYDVGAVTMDALFVYAVAPAALIIDTLETIAQNGPGTDDGLVVQLRQGNVNAGDTLIAAAWAWAAVTFQTFRAFVSNPGPDYDRAIPYDAQHWDGRPVDSGTHQHVFVSMPCRVNPTLALLFVAYLGPDTAGRIDTPAGWTPLPALTGGAPGETQRTVAAFYRVVDDCSPVDCTLTLHGAGAGARYYASLILVGQAQASGTDNSLSATLCSAPAAEPSLAMPAAGTNRGWYSLDCALLKGKQWGSLVCPSAANDNWGRLWWVRWSGDYPPVPDSPVEILTEGVFGAGLLAGDDRGLFAFYTLASSPNRLRYRRSQDGGATWSAEVQVIDGGGPGSAIATAKPSDSNNALPVVLLSNGRVVAGSRLLQWDDGAEEWTFLATLANTTPTGGSSQTLAATGDSLQLLRDRTVMRARSASTLLRAGSILDDGTVNSDLRTPPPAGPHVALTAFQAAWINAQAGLLLALRVRAPGINGAVIFHPLLSPRSYSWRVYQLDSDELYALSGSGGDLGVNVGDERQWEGPATLWWDPDSLTAYGASAHAYSNGVCRLRIDAAGIWWLLRPDTTGALRFARGRRLTPWGTMAWDGK